MSDAALAHLRAHREGTLIAAELASRIRFIADSATGRLVFPAPAATISADSLTLFIPEEDPQVGDELQLMLAAEELDPAHESCDRWRAYHGEPRLSRWAIAAIDGAKFAGEVVEHEPLSAPNAIRAAEPRLCKRLNSDRAALAAACARLSRIEIKEPLAVGIDPGGIDVRARFGIVRAPFSTPALTPEQADAAVDVFLGAHP